MDYVSASVLGVAGDTAVVAADWALASLGLADWVAVVVVVGIILAAVWSGSWR